MNDYRLGFADFEPGNDTTVTVEGEIPAWLKGTYLRNGSGRFHFEKQNALHWFDGLSLVSKFDFDVGAVSYQSTLLNTREKRTTDLTGHYGEGQFATSPQLTLLQKIKSAFSPLHTTDNTAVNIIPMGDVAWAMTEVPTINCVDKASLAITSQFDFTDSFNYHLTTAHPHYDAAKNKFVNIAAAVGRKTFYYLFEVDMQTRKPTQVCKLPTSSISYQHSFALTERYAVIFDSPLQLDVFKLLLSGKNIGSSFIDSFKWHPGRGTRLLIIDRQANTLLKTVEIDDCFMFHVMNSFEEQGQLIIDFYRYADPAIIKQLYFSSLLQGQAQPDSKLNRLVINLNTYATELSELSNSVLELGRYNYQLQGHSYRYLYSAGWPQGQSFFTRLVKSDLKTGHEYAWHGDDCYPGEPIFVANPAHAAEDDGVVLSVVLDAKAERSFLLILDAQSFEERARVLCPQAIPFGLHGNFLKA